MIHSSSSFQYILQCNRGRSQRAAGLKGVPVKTKEVLRIDFFSYAAAIGVAEGCSCINAVVCSYRRWINGVEWSLSLVR